MASMHASMQDPWNARLLQFYQHQIATHPSYVYGEGFRGARAAYLKCGLNAVVDHVCQYKRLPNA